MSWLPGSKLFWRRKPQPSCKISKTPDFVSALASSPPPRPPWVPPSLLSAGIGSRGSDGSRAGSRGSRAESRVDARGSRGSRASRGSRLELSLPFRGARGVSGGMGFSVCGGRAGVLSVASFAMCCVVTFGNQKVEMSDAAGHEAERKNPIEKDRKFGGQKLGATLGRERPRNRGATASPLKPGEQACFDAIIPYCRSFANTATLGKNRASRRRRFQALKRRYRVGSGTFRRNPARNQSRSGHLPRNRNSQSAHPSAAGSAYRGAYRF